MPEPADPRLVGYLGFLRGLDAIALSAYRGEAADLAEDDDADGRLARALLPLVDAVLVEAEAREMLKAEIAQDVTDEDFAEFWQHFRALARGRRELGLPVEGLAVLKDAVSTYNAALVHEKEQHASDQ